MIYLFDLSVEAIQKIIQSYAEYFLRNHIIIIFSIILIIIIINFLNKLNTNKFKDELNNFFPPAFIKITFWVMLFAILIYQLIYITYDFITPWQFICSLIIPLLIIVLPNIIYKLIAFRKIFSGLNEIFKKYINKDILVAKDIFFIVFFIYWFLFGINNIIELEENNIAGQTQILIFLLSFLTTLCYIIFRYDNQNSRYHLEQNLYRFGTHIKHGFRIFQNRKILFLGIQKAGKTTLIQSLDFGLDPIGKAHNATSTPDYKAFDIKLESGIDPKLNKELTLFIDDCGGEFLGDALVNLRKFTYDFLCIVLGFEENPKQYNLNDYIIKLFDYSQNYLCALNLAIRTSVNSMKMPDYLIIIVNNHKENDFKPSDLLIGKEMIKEKLKEYPYILQCVKNPFESTRHLIFSHGICRDSISDLRAVLYNLIVR